jgi:hypothetical protein
MISLRWCQEAPKKDGQARKNQEGWENCIKNVKKNENIPKGWHVRKHQRRMACQEESKKDAGSIKEGCREHQRRMQDASKKDAGSIKEGVTVKTGRTSQPA